MILLLIYIVKIKINLKDMLLIGIDESIFTHIHNILMLEGCPKDRNKPGN
jgi:hypothetical protein